MVSQGKRKSCLMVSTIRIWTWAESLVRVMEASRGRSDCKAFDICRVLVRLMEVRKMDSDHKALGISTIYL